MRLSKQETTYVFSINVVVNVVKSQFVIIVSYYTDHYYDLLIKTLDPEHKLLPRILSERSLFTIHFSGVS